MEISKILKCFGLFSTNLENMLQKASRKVKNPMQLQVSVQNKTFIVESAICSNFRENPLGKRLIKEGSHMRPVSRRAV